MYAEPCYALHRPEVFPGDPERRVTGMRKKRKTNDERIRDGNPLILKLREADKKWLKRSGTVLACLVAFVTTYTLILPAVTLTDPAAELQCDIPLHQHSDNCYVEELVFDSPEDTVGHVERHTVCGYADYVVHTHDEACYDAEGNLICNLPEIPEHQHDETCYTEQRILVCGQEESDAPDGHIHTDECYETRTALTCGQLELHTHTDECFDENGQLICGQTQLLAHQHDASCLPVAQDDTDDSAADAEATDADAATQAEAGPAGAVAGASGQDVSEDSDGESDAVTDDGDRTDDNDSLRTAEDDADDSDAARVHDTKSDSLNDRENGNSGEATMVTGLLRMTGSVNVDDVTITAGCDIGVLPEGVQLKATVVDKEAYADKVAKATGKKDTAVKTFDIQFVDADGQEVEPDGDVRVTFEADFIEKKTDPEIVHIHDDGQAELVESRIRTGELTMKTDSFSVYAISYTVDFHWEVDGKTYDFSIPGGGYISLTDLVEVLGIAGNDTEKDSQGGVMNGTAADSGTSDDAHGTAAADAAGDTALDSANASGDTVENVSGGADETGKIDETGKTDGTTQTAGSDGTDEASKTSAGNKADGTAETGTTNGTEDTGEATDSDSLLLSGNLAISEATRKFVADVEKVEFSSPELVWVGKVEEDATIGALKDEHDLACEYSAELTEEEIAEINAQTVATGDWALISRKPFISTETLNVIMKDGDQFEVWVTDAQIDKTVISASGENYEITVTYGEDARIPDGAELKVREILPEDEEYDALMKKSSEAVESSVNLSKDDLLTGEFDNESDQMFIHQAKFFDIKILDEGLEIEPESRVEVSITKLNTSVCGLFDEDKSSLTEDIIHFVNQDRPELISGVIAAETNRGIKVSFATDSFSSYGSIAAGATKVIGLNDTVTLNSTHSGGTWEFLGDVSDSFATITGSGNNRTFSSKSQTGTVTVRHTYIEGNSEAYELYRIQIADDTKSAPQKIPTVTNGEANIVRFYMIDYDTTQALDDERNQGSNGYYSTYNNQGINVGHPLRFLGWGASAFDGTYGNINNYTGLSGVAERPVQNIVQDTLVGGYPKVNGYGPNETLAYLFNSSNDGTNKQVYSQESDDISMFQYADGYYEYNSNTNYAYFDTNSKDFTIYDRTYYQQSSGRKAVGFFPFDDVSKALYSGNGWTNDILDERTLSVSNFNSGNYQLPNKYYLNPDNGASTTSVNGGRKNNGKSAGYWNHHLGINMAVDFNVSVSGKNDYGDDTVFEFNGDDDMWVFVDGKLVLDIGGIHQPVDGSINFRTGEVYVQGINSPQKNLYDLFDRSSFVDLDKPHRLEVFYIERGGCDSNCKIRFNLANKDPEFGSIHFKKIAPNMAPVPGAVFQLFYDEECTQPLKRTTEEIDTIRRKFDQGNYNYSTEVVTATADENGSVVFPVVITGTYYMKEISVPEGYLDPSIIRSTVYKVEVDKDPQVEAGGSISHNENDNTRIYMPGVSTPLEKLGVENEKASVNVKKIDASGCTLAGADFEVEYTPENGSSHVAKTVNLTVDESGKLLLDGPKFLEKGKQYDEDGEPNGLPNGVYTVRETRAPVGYVLPDDPSFSFTISNGLLVPPQNHAGVMFDAETLTFSIVNALEPLPDGQLGITKKWLDYQGNLASHSGTLDLTLVQWVPKNLVSVNFYYKGGGNGSPSSYNTLIETKRASGSGRLEIEWKWDDNTILGSDGGRISITGISGYSVQTIEKDKKFKLIVDSVPEGATIDILVDNWNYNPWKPNGSYIGDISLSDSSSGSSYQEITRQKIVLESSENWKKIFMVDGNGLMDSNSITSGKLPSTYNGKSCYYTILEENVPVGFESMVSTEHIHDKGTLLVTNKAKVSTTDISIKKVKEDSSTGLSDAIFQLFIKKDNSYRLIQSEDGIEGLSTISVDNVTFAMAFKTDGNAKTLTKLPDGEYRMDEVHTPAGYVNTLGSVYFKIENGVITSQTADNSDKATLDTSGNIALLIVANTPGAALPNTGGSGTHLFYLLGGILIALAGAGLVIKRRRRDVTR